MNLLNPNLVKAVKLDFGMVGALLARIMQFVQAYLIKYLRGWQ